MLVMLLEKSRVKYKGKKIKETASDLCTKSRVRGMPDAVRRKKLTTKMSQYVFDNLKK